MSECEPVVRGHPINACFRCGVSGNEVRLGYSKFNNGWLCPKCAGTPAGEPTEGRYAPIREGGYREAISDAAKLVARSATDPSEGRRLESEILNLLRPAPSEPAPEPSDVTDEEIDGWSQEAKELWGTLHAGLDRLPDEVEGHPEYAARLERVYNAIPALCRYWSSRDFPRGAPVAPAPYGAVTLTETGKREMAEGRVQRAEWFGRPPEDTR